MKSTRSNHPHKQAPAISYPVSEKFLRYVMERISSAASVANLGCFLTGQLERAILIYIKQRRVPSTKEDSQLLLAFCLLRPEIDKAISRSEAARARAAKRRELKKESSTQPQEAPEVQPAETCEAPKEAESDSHAKEQQTDPSGIMNQSAVNENHEPEAATAAITESRRKRCSRRRRHKRRS